VVAAVVFPVMVLVVQVAEEMLELQVHQAHLVLVVEVAVLLELPILILVMLEVLVQSY
jgi:hypothetical protein